MKKEKEPKKKEIKEPYKPEDTPKPPQKVRPHSGSGNPSEGDVHQQKKAQEKKDQKNQRPRLLADDAEIDDETTI